ncbi:hypothetical protein M409DRAFT_69794 [Zasmidium cellare ATCC 36951]|uniref:FAD dependent oxidoreductase domain-containing protein n=1 Tax=Zasmidium cellare ATCC 36951 TaxID=1080233 RepID=A0A6A6C5H8_ZASCE|nr:uncharacterized protein M409DRAFT_69794 [Zasmidium cellare ATCC 36951]KAF2161450.1 hypothetical protein M409DRAFT_69794 [Zasmidium cellare ATCC 36951]
MANKPNLSPDSKIIIVGAGIFGLSTALHLTKRGYKNIHIFDRQPFDKNHYAEDLGAHGASCDLNKIIRASYGGEKLYQDLAFKAMPVWTQWNDELARSEKADLPEALDPEIKLWHNCGFLRLSRDGLERKERETQEGFPEGIRHTQFRVSDAQRVRDAVREGIPKTKIDPFRRGERGLPVDGVLDMTAGFALASRACTWVLHLLKKTGSVTTYFGEGNGLESLTQTGDKITSITTSSGSTHPADLVIVACGGWTPSLIPSTEPLLETTSGSVLAVQLPPKTSRPDLWSKYSEDNFPVWSWNMASYTPHSADHIGGLYGLPVTPEGVVKVAFRGAKWTNYTRKTSDGKTALSYPRTDLDKVPAEAMRVLRSFCEENLPDLLELPLSTIRLCWYTDSVDNSFLIDYVPDVANLVVASGGSGHGFKFLPVLGECVVDVVEGRDTEYTRLFSWRDVPSGKRNGLEEGPEGWRVLGKQRLVGGREWKGGVGSKL